MLQDKTTYIIKTKFIIYENNNNNKCCKTIFPLRAGLFNLVDGIHIYIYWERDGIYTWMIMIAYFTREIKKQYVKLSTTLMKRSLSYNCVMEKER